MTMNFRNTLLQLLLYLVVGGLATLVEWGTFFVLNAPLSLHYAAATALAFIASTFANWLFGRLILFRDTQKSKAATAKELLKIYAVSVAGLVMNLAIMFVAVEECAISEMPAKILATGIVFAWNFLVRKLVIYKV